MQTKSIKTMILAGAFLSLSAMFQGTAAAQRYRSPWETNVRSQLAMVAAVGLGENIYASHDPFIGTLREDTYTDIRYTLQRGVNYGLVGVCDQQCYDLDLKLYDANGNLIDQDVGDDAEPLVSVTPKWTGTYYLRVSMPSCSTSLCYFGTQAFRR